MLESDIFKYNRHFEKGFQYPYPIKRRFYQFLNTNLQSRQILEIVGLRRVGKSTLFFQMINQLIDSGTNPFQIWYFTFDEEKPTVDDLIQHFSRLTQLDWKQEKIYLFLDEIQKLPNFQNQVKVYYDLYPNLKFFISGSTSLFIRKKTQESLAGRITRLFLPPLDFKEYLSFKDKAEICEKPQLFKQEIEREFETFLRCQFIESMNMPDPHTRKEYFQGILRKIVYEDIVQVFPVDYPEILWRILKLIAQRPGLLVDYRSLSTDLGISNKTVSRYFYYLEEAFLLRKVYNFSRNLMTSEKKLKRFYLASPSFSWALTDFISEGLLVENLVISLNDYRFFWRDAYQHEVDFVDIKGDEIIPLEIKYKNGLTSKDTKNLRLFARKFKISRALILTKTMVPQILSSPECEIYEDSIFN